LLKPGERVEPEVKSFNENLEASTRGLIPELIDFLKRAFGDQLAIEGDSIQWRANAT
jgi:hypothetical protein